MIAKAKYRKKLYLCIVKWLKCQLKGNLLLITIALFACLLVSLSANNERFFQDIEAVCAAL